MSTRHWMPALLVLLSALPTHAGDVRIARLTAENWDEFAPHGKEVDAIYGDLVLRNDHVVAVVAQPKPTRHANMTVRSIGGQLIDLTTPDTQRDQLSAFYVGKRKYPFNEWQVRTNGRAVSMEGFDAAEGEAGTIVVRSPGTADRPTVETHYRLESGAKHLTIRTTYTASKAMTLPVEDDMRIDNRNEDIRFSTNGVHDLFWAHDRYRSQAYGFEVEDGRVQSTTTRGVVLRYRTGESDGSVELKAGESHTVVTRIFPAADTLAVRANVAARNDVELQPFGLTVVDGKDRPLQNALVSFKRDKATYGAARTDGQGRIETKLPAGGVKLTVTTMGVMAGQYDVNVKNVRTDVAVATEFAPGQVSGRIVDADGDRLPAKIEFRPKGDGTEPDWGPHTGEGAVGNLIYAVSGSFNQPIPPGEYDVIVSRGPEYDAVFTEVTVEPGGRAEVNATLPRVVDTTGWVSTDYHSHSSPSGDNTGSQAGRVQNLVCEHVEFAPCTEHNRISTYDHLIAAFKAEAYIRTVSGMELTGRPLPLNHQNCFPLIRKPHEQDGGAPVTDTDVERQVERLALWDDRSRKLIQQNHPDIGWLFRDRNGDGEPDDGHPRILPHIDAMEIHPISEIGNLGPVDIRDGKPTGNNRVFNWLQLLNQGHRIVGVVNTDAHYNFHGSGGLRNWVRSTTDAPAAIDVDEMVAHSEAGNVLMSNGPFLEFTVAHGENRYNIGDGLTAKDGKVSVAVKVQCPNWIEIDRVFLLANGRVLEEFDFGPEAIDEKSVVRFERTADLVLESDTHLVAIAVGQNSTLGHVQGPFWGKQHPAALTNPIWIDVDGNGFTPNEDTLGSPLPVKYGTK